MDPCAISTSIAQRRTSICYDLEGRNLLLVLGEYIWQQEVISPADQWKWAVEEVRKLAEYARSLGLELALEIEPFQLSIVNNIELMDKFLSDVDHPAAKANIDISHLALARDEAGEISKLKDALRTYICPTATVKSTAIFHRAGVPWISLPIWKPWQMPASREP